MKTIIKHLLCFFAVLVTVAAILFCSIFFWLQSSSGLEWLQTHINKTIPGNITFGKCRLSLLKTGIDLDRVVLSDPQGIALAGFSRLSLKTDWDVTRPGKIRVKRLILQDPWLDLSVHKGGRLNLVSALTVSVRKKKSTATGPGILQWLSGHIVFDSVQMVNGRFSYTPPDDTGQLESTGINFKAAGNLSSRSGNIDLTVSRVLFSSAEIHPESASIVLKAALDGNTLKIPVFDVSTGQTALSFSSSVKNIFTKPIVDGILSADTQLAELKSMFNLPGDFSGRVSTTITLQGALENSDASLVLSVAEVLGMSVLEGNLPSKMDERSTQPPLTGELVMQGTALRAENVTIGDVAVHMKLHDGTVMIDQLHLANNDSRLSAKGSVALLSPDKLGLLKDPLFDLTVESVNLDPGDFIEKAGGHFSLKGRLTGSIDKPFALLSLTGEKVFLADQSLETILLEARIEEHRLWLDRFTAEVSSGGQLKGDGWVDFEKNFEFRLATDGVPVSEIEQLQKFFPGDGQLHFEGTGKGNIQNPDIEGLLTISDISINKQPFEDIQLSFSQHDKQIRLKGALNFALDATYNLENGDINSQLKFDSTETGPYFRAAGKHDLHGKLTGNVTVSGNTRDTANLTALVDLKSVQLFFKDISLVQADLIELKISNQQILIPELDLVVLSSGDLRLQGEVGIDGPLHFAFRGRIPLAASGAFSNGLVDSTGTIVFTGKVFGTIDAPQVEADIDLQDIGMVVPGLTQKVHDVNGRIKVHENIITINDLNGYLDTGSFRASGTVEYEKLKPTRIDARIDAKSLPLEISDTMSVLLDGEVAVTGSGRTVDAKGKIVMQEGVYYKDMDVNLLKLATAQRRTVAPRTTPVSIPYFKTVNLDLDLGSRQPFLVQNNLAQLEIRPDLKIQGSLASPVINGRAQVTSGTITFQKKIFNVTRGVVDYVNPYKTEAEIDIEGETTIRSWQITLGIQGTPDKLALRLSSIPAETDSDILSLLLFGRTGREIASGTGVGQLRTEQIMAEMIVDTFGAEVKETTGMDILQMETNSSSNEQNSAGLKVTVGKHLSDRMTVKYAAESKDGEFIQRAITEYKLLENILVSGYQDNKGTYGSELMFRIEFR